MAITVHHLNRSRSTRVLWMLRELQLPYEVKAWQRDANFRAPDGARSVHPLGRFPMVEVDDTVLAESGAILEHFADRTGALRPTDPAHLADYRFFLHYGEGSAMPPLLVQLIVEKLKDAPVFFLLKPIVQGIAGKVEQSYSGPAIQRHFDFVNAHLDGREFFAGDALSMADIQMLYPVQAALTRGSGDWPHMQRWLDAMMARPALKAALEEGGAM